MAIRLRWENGKWVALCAAKHPKEYGDIYLDDAQDHALRKKYLRDFISEARGVLGMPNLHVEYGAEIGEAVREKERADGGR